MASSFFDDATRQATTAAIQAIEAVTSAEIVVTVHQRSGEYRDADLLWGIAAAALGLAAILYLPQSFEVSTIPLDLGVLGLVGSLASSRSPALRRLFTSRRRRAAATQRAARAAFYDLGVSRTSGRTGILVYVSAMERQVALVPDVGVPVEALGEGWGAVTAALQEAVARGSADAGPFLAALARLGPLLEGPLPRQEDDVNELPDEVVHR